MPMNISDVVVVGGPLSLVPAGEVEALESQLWIRFPSGYREYMERLGEGDLGGVVWIYTPSRIEHSLVEWRRRIKKYWFWNETLDLLPKERAAECVILGENCAADELIFHPCRPDRLFLLPNSDGGALEVGSNLLEAIEWLCNSSEQAESRVPDRNFVPEPNAHLSSMIPVPVRGEDDKQIDPVGESLDDLVELGRQWVERHSAREWCQNHVDELEEWVGKGTTTELIFDGIVLTGTDMMEGYVLKYSVMDAQSKNSLGVFQIYSNYDYNSQRATSWSYSFVEEIIHPRPKYSRHLKYARHRQMIEDQMERVEPKES